MDLTPEEIEEKRLADEKAEHDAAVARGDIIEDEDEDKDDEKEGDDLEDDSDDDDDSGDDDSGDDDADSDADSDEDGDDDKDDDKKEPMLPKSRYDSVRQQNNQLQERIDKLEAEQQQKDDEAEKEDAEAKLNEEIDALDDKLTDAMKDNDMEAVKALRKEIRGVERKLFQAEMQETAEASGDDAKEAIRMDMLIDQMEEDFPQLKPGSDDYSEDVVNAIQDLRYDFDQSGRYTPTQSLLKATKMILGAAAQAETKDTGVKEKDDKDEVAEQRKKKNLKKKLDAADKQPPETDDVGDTGSSGGKNKKDPSINDLTEEDYDALPEATKRRMRGDEVV